MESWWYGTGAVNLEGLLRNDFAGGDGADESAT